MYEKPVCGRGTKIMDFPKRRFSNQNSRARATGFQSGHPRAKITQSDTILKKEFILASDSIPGVPVAYS